jgi:hypothetical protein
VVDAEIVDDEPTGYEAPADPPSVPAAPQVRDEPVVVDDEPSTGERPGVVVGNALIGAAGGTAPSGGPDLGTGGRGACGM